MGDASARPLRVLWVIKGLGPGGAEQLLLEHARAMGPDVEATAVYVVPWKDQLVPSLEEAGVPCRCLSTGRSRDWRWVARLRRLLVEEPVDVIHVHSPLLAATLRLAVRTVRPRPALVTTEHNVWARHRLPTRAANRATVGLEDALLAVSDGVRDSMPARIRGRVEVVVHGIHLDGVRAADSDRAATRAALGFGAGDVVCITVANLRREKGYDDLLDAARIVLDRCPRARFLAAGQGPLEAELAARHAELRLGDRFRFLGYRTDVPTLLAAADLFVLASHHEGLPVALMEALASGLPVVATAVGGVPEAVHDGVEGVLVPAGQPDTLADAVLALVADPGSRARMGRAARARAEDYDVSRAVARIEEVYRAVARS